MPHRRALAISCVAAGAVALAGCRSGGGHEAGVARAKPASAYQIGSLTAEQAAPWGGEPGMLRGSAANSGADVTLDVTYRKGRITPPPGIVRLSGHERLEITVMSDQRERVVVAGYPEASTMADEGQPAKVTLDTIRAGTYRVTLQPGDVLVTVLRVQ
jgi:hypothetical protein